MRVRHAPIFLGILCGACVGSSPRRDPAEPVARAVVVDPTITVTPGSAPVTAIVTIRGSGFGSSGGPMRFVTFNGVPALMYQLWSDSEVQAMVPGNGTSGQIVVWIDGVAKGGPDFVVATPQITAVSPSAAPVGTQIAVTGSNLPSGPGPACCGRSDWWASLVIGGVPTMHIFGWQAGAARIDGAIIPVNAGSGQIELRVRTGTMGFDENGVPALTGSTTLVVAGPQFTVSTPRITAVNRSRVPAGARLTVSGESFPRGPGSPCCDSNWWAGLLLDGIPLMHTLGWSAGASQIDGVFVPANARSGNLELRVRLGAMGFDVTGRPGLTGTSTLSVFGPMIAVAAPTITQVTPSAGPIGTQLTLDGTDLFPGPGAVCCRSDWWGGAIIGDVPLMHSLGWDQSGASRIGGIVVPANATSGPVEMRIKVGAMGFGPSGVPTLTGSDVLVATGPTFTVTAPAISDVTPRHGPVGTRISILGQNLPPGPGTPCCSSDWSAIAHIQSVPLLHFQGWPAGASRIDNVEIPSGATTGPVNLVVRFGTMGFSPAGPPMLTGTAVVTISGPTFTVGTPPPPNDPPAVDAGGSYTVDEGGAVLLTATTSDPEGAAVTVDWDLNGDGVFEVSGQTVSFSAALLDGPSTVGVVARATDAGGLSATAPATVHVLNVAPSVGAIVAPTDPIQIGTHISVSARVNDPGAADTFSGIWDWGDGTTSAAVIQTGEEPTAEATHAFAAPGVFRITLTVTDDDGASGLSTFQYLVAYNPDGGFVTGGGWIQSPAGAYAANPSSTGKATFGFVSKYANGQSQPSGSTQFSSWLSG